MSELRVGHGPRAGALVRFGFGDEAGDVRVACTRLAGPDGGETWFELRDAAGDSEFSLLSMDVDEEACGGLEAATAEAYRQLLARVRPSTHPFLLRIWNYFGAINAGDGDAERYRRFCVGRASAVDAMFNDPPPAATAIGTPHHTGRVQLIALCTRRPGLALENPRQTPAWRYPRDYGPVPPGFSRGALMGDGAGLRLLASGTASIVGHVSQHPGDAAAQLHESLANLEVLLHEGAQRSGRRFALERFDALRVYLRDAADLDAVRDALRTRVPLDDVLFLHGDICRRELLVELEGAFAAL